MNSRLSRRAAGHHSNLLVHQLHRLAALVFTASAACLSISAEKLGICAEKRSVPNIVIILADDLGYGDLGCYGQKKIRTPHLDALAAGGMRFTQAYSGSTVCAPSRCSLMTGKHTGHAFIRGNHEIQPEGQAPLPADTFTVARLFQQAGYRTGLFGKWGLGGPGSTGVPNRQGFDEFFGYLCQRKAHDYYPEYLWRDQQQVPLAGKQYSHDLIAAEALAFVRRCARRPFFLYLAFTIPHAKLQVPSDAPYTAEAWPQQEKNFAAMITRMDADVGRLMALLKELGLDESTLVFFASDNGAMRDPRSGHTETFFSSNGGLRGIKRDLYEGGIRVPLLARWPGKVAPGTVSTQVCAFWDFLPTMAELLHQPPSKGIDGISILPTLLGRGEQPQHDYLYWEFHERGFAQAIRWVDWKGVRPGLGKPLELYDLKSDLTEQRNLAALHPQTVARLEGFLKNARTDSQLFPAGRRPKTEAARPKAPNVPRKKSG